METTSYFDLVVAARTAATISAVVICGRDEIFTGLRWLHNEPASPSVVTPLPAWEFDLKGEHDTFRRLDREDET